MKKVKRITPIKSETLCAEKCKYGYDNNACRERECKNCKMNDEQSRTRGGKRCKCLGIHRGEPCPYFERYQEEVQK